MGATIRCSPCAPLPVSAAARPGAAAVDGDGDVPATEVGEHLAAAWPGANWIVTPSCALVGKEHRDAGLARPLRVDDRGHAVDGDAVAGWAVALDRHGAPAPVQLNLERATAKGGL
jgi:hypothetical protein